MSNDEDESSEEPQTLPEEEKQRSKKIFTYNGVEYEIQSEIDNEGSRPTSPTRQIDMPNNDNGTDRETEQRGPTFLIGSSRMGNIIKSMKANNLKRKCIAKFKGGTTIEWAKQTASDLQPNITTVYQTGINNILNKGQTTKNIVEQFRKLTSEGVKRRQRSS